MGCPPIGKPVENAYFWLFFEVLWGLVRGLVSWELGFVGWVLGFVFWVSGFVFWVLGFVSWVLGFVFWVLGFVFWVRPQPPRKKLSRT